MSYSCIHIPYYLYTNRRSYPKPINDLNTQTDTNGPKIRKYKNGGLAYKNILQVIQFERIYHLSKATQSHPQKYQSERGKLLPVLPLFDLLFCTFRLDAVHERVFNFTLPLCAMSWSIHSACGERRISAYRWVRLVCCSKFTVDRFSRSEIIPHASTGIDFYERPKKNHFNTNFKPRTTNPEVLRRISGCVRNYHRCCSILHDKWVRHHSMVCPQVADEGTFSNMEGRCECIE